MNRNVWLLFLCQSLTNASTLAFASVSALIGYSLATDKSLATLPYALQMLGTMCASIPAGIVFARLGRKPGFLLGVTGTFIGTVISGLAVWRGDFALFCVGALPCGLGFGIAQHYRFAAAEVADSTRRARAISLVMAGGVLSALLAPSLVKYTKDLAGPLLFVGTYAFLALLPVLAAILLTLAKLPPALPPTVSLTPLRTIILRPQFAVAVVAGMVAYGSMNLIMAATALQMMLCGFGVNDSTTVISAHAFCMYAPGFFTGRLIQRFGAHRVVLVGGGLILGCVGLSLSGSAYTDFLAALMVLGLGWNFMFVGATSLLSLAHDGAERLRAQSANDFLVFATVATTALSSGAIQAAHGWVALNFTVAGPVILAMGLVAWQWRGRLSPVSPV